MKLSIAIVGAIAASAMAAPAARCMVNGKVVSCDSMAERLEAYAERYYKAHPEELEKLKAAQAAMEKQQSIELKD
ncbi:hypothetical protein BDV96DRAFT_653898 [Lophiotrema nucula]|uniref:Uncharacterized protein n=1 Tax=Lophiotrema nucula TaxID=690887 RepID=A0A6A5YMB9_9PLEO|nr:hypothetical protein BDV96DRAFT_653898 [Lophiotrema nucula]